MLPVTRLIVFVEEWHVIVNTLVMQAFADIAKSDKELRPSLSAHLSELTATGTPAIKAREKTIGGIQGLIQQDRGSGSSFPTGPISPLVGVVGR